MDLLKPINVGPVRIDAPVILAPMTGVTDLPFRRMVKRYGAGLTVSEMIASEAMIRETRQSLQKSLWDPAEEPVSLQLAGCEPQVMAEAAKLNEQRGAAIIDINMGCPVRKVVNGDICSIEDSREALRQSGADGVMIGRGAYGRPWLIGQVMSELSGGGHRPEPSLDEQLAAMLDQYDDMLRLYGTQTGVNLARKHIGWYTKGLPGSAELRNTINQQAEPEVVVRMLQDFYAPWLARSAA